ncbi:GDP dissociation inhibitor [Parasitella parasitica]|nr:GDP dissociation inhibitor [Parasitella parasitica]
MDEHYDIIILGTGLTECILSGIFSAEGKKVLHIDRNEYYGGESASLDLLQLYKKRGTEISEVPADLGQNRDYKIDLIPKFMMAGGEIVRFLTDTNVTRYLEIRQISGSYVYKEGAILKLPADKMEALSTPLLGVNEKFRLQKFLEFVQNWKDDDESSHQDLDIDSQTMLEVYDKFELEAGTRIIIGHGLALHLDDQYLAKPARETIENITLYFASLGRFGKSPYIYPLYGLGDLPQSFARFGALHGGTYMLNKSVDEILYDDGVAVGVRSGKETAKATQIICDPSYAKDKIKPVGKVVRAICILEKPIPDTNEADSVQIVIPQNELSRKHDIYIASVSGSHSVCPEGKYLAIVSTIVETTDPESEIEAGLNMLGTIREKFVFVSELEEPSADGVKDNVYISKSYDATSHFETVCEDVKSIYKRMTGKELNLGALNLKKAEKDN